MHRVLVEKVQVCSNPQAKFQNLLGLLVTSLAGRLLIGGDGDGKELSALLPYALQLGTSSRPPKTTSLPTHNHKACTRQTTRAPIMRIRTHSEIEMIFNARLSGASKTK